MRYEIILSPMALENLRRLDAHRRAGGGGARGGHLPPEPPEGSRGRVKRAPALAQPQYRLRVGDIRVFYDVVEARVEILAILFKPMVDEWLQEAGRPL